MDILVYIAAAAAAVRTVSFSVWSVRSGRLLPAAGAVIFTAIAVIMVIAVSMKGL